MLGTPLAWRPLKIAPPRGKTLQSGADEDPGDRRRPPGQAAPRRHPRRADRRRRPARPSDIGKIDVFATRAYVAISRALANKALERLRAGKIKGRNFRVRPLG